MQYLLSGVIIVHNETTRCLTTSLSSQQTTVFLARRGPRRHAANKSFFIAFISARCATSERIERVHDGHLQHATLMLSFVSFGCQPGSQPVCGSSHLRAKRLAASLRDPLAPQTALGAALDDAGLQSDPAKHQPGMLILLRHGQSIWNLENRFTGWANVDLSHQGEREALDAANLLLSEPELRIDLCYTSVLKRAVRTAEICLDQYELHSPDAGRVRPPIISRWRLNERHCECQRVDASLSCARVHLPAPLLEIPDPAS